MNVLKRFLSEKYFYLVIAMVVTAMLTSVASFGMPFITVALFGIFIKVSSKMTWPMYYWLIAGSALMTIVERLTSWLVG